MNSNCTYKNIFPFRIGTTSYVFPADILPNVERLAPLVDDIELVLFESGTESNLPDASLIRELKKIADSHCLSYTVHFPIDLKAGSSNPLERKRYTERTCSILERTRELDPYAYIMHFEGIEDYAATGQILTWQANVRSTLDPMRQASLPANRICIENLAYPWTWHSDLVAEYGFSNCCDVGHLWVANRPEWIEDCVALMPQTRVIHLHGTQENRDHISLGQESPDRIELLAKRFLRHYRHVLTIETFNENDTFSSLEVLRKTWDNLQL